MHVITDIKISGDCKSHPDILVIKQGERARKLRPQWLPNGLRVLVNLKCCSNCFAGRYFYTVVDQDCFDST